jgi:hypothetical protein
MEFDVWVRRDGVRLSVAKAEGPERIAFMASLPEEPLGCFRRVLLAVEPGGSEAIERAIQEIDQRWPPPSWLEGPVEGDVDHEVRPEDSDRFPAPLLLREGPHRRTAALEVDNSSGTTLAFDLETEHLYIETPEAAVVELRALVTGTGTLEVDSFNIGGGMNLLYGPWVVHGVQSNARRVSSESLRMLRAFPSFDRQNRCQARVFARGKIFASLTVILRKVSESPRIQTTLYPSV